MTQLTSVLLFTYKIAIMFLLAFLNYFIQIEIQKCNLGYMLGEIDLKDLMIISMKGADIINFGPSPDIRQRESDSVRARRQFDNGKKQSKVYV